ncbi:Copper P-type ATPase [Mycena indigotica]|uniref:Coatomer subunit delta n=1 Tax=Mycena indigotica TaxID=2126181 RepID=A0A8H6S7A8_9AGAR|nr:Copper P-type ATPase [Mycena indigotica]KAF7293618.1 Copper P-type ATPase [Mycena indigotica]
MARSVLRLKPWLPQQPFICLDHGHLLSVHSLCQPARNSLLGQRTIIRVTTTRFPHSTCQFLDMSRTRIESLLASFPKLLPPPSSTQHTLIETPDASNLLRDIDMLYLLVRVASDMCQSVAESQVATRALELLGAFDEVVGIEHYKEKIQEIIARNKEAEAKEELKCRAKQLELQWREQQRRAAGNSGFSLSGYGGGIIGYSPVPTSYTPPPPTVSTPINLNTVGQQLIDALGSDYMASGIGLASEPPTPSVAAAPQTVQSTNKGRGSLPEVVPESINISITEQITCSLLRDGGLEKDIELKGDTNDSNSLVAALQFKQHPQVAKFDAKANRNEAKKIALRDASKTFPINQNLAVLKWRYKGNNKSTVPLSINCWPTPSNDGTCEVSIEFELENESVILHGLEIFIPLPILPDSLITHQFTCVDHCHCRCIIAKLFTVGGDDPETFFPVRVAFVGKGSLAGVGIAQTSLEDGADAVFSVDSSLGERSARGLAQLTRTDHRISPVGLASIHQWLPSPSVAGALPLVFLHHPPHLMPPKPTNRPPKPAPAPPHHHDEQSRRYTQHWLR